MQYRWQGTPEDLIYTNVWKWLQTFYADGLVEIAPIEIVAPRVIVRRRYKPTTLTTETDTMS